MPLTLTKNHHTRSDAQGALRHIRHVQAPYAAAGGGAITPQTLASAYLHDVASLYGIDPGALGTLSESPGQRRDTSEASQLRLEREKVSLANRIVAYRQTYQAIPVWGAGLSVVLDEDDMVVTSSTSTLHDISGVVEPTKRPRFLPGSTRWQAALCKDLAKKNKASFVSVNGAKAWVYRYDPDAREHAHEGPGEQDGRGPILALPEVGKGIEPGAHYLCTELLFTLAVGPWPALNFRALVEAYTGSILYLRPGVEGVDGMVFITDPQSLSGDATIGPCSPAATLDPLRTTMELLGLDVPDPGDDQALTGEYVSMGEQAAPNIAPPTEAVGSDFNYSSLTDDFAAVQGYYTVDAMFRYIEALGFDLSTYFGGTTFPITVDARDASLGTVNARAYANTGFTGSGGFGFNLCQVGCPVGITSDLRIAWHEMAHALLLDHVGNYNFGFAHSCGDALGVILSDAIAQAPDRFDTFVFNTIGRRHDRDVTAGWAWGGTNDTGGYQAESILATTLFRFYNSTGGDSTRAADRRLAADHAAFLIIGAVSTLTSINPANDADDFATALMDFDKANDFLGDSRGALHKVLRWAFEKQGLYQPPGAPTPVVSEGAPPDVDVYIDDGRGGEYPYQRNFWSSPDMWNRRAADGDTTHEAPLLDATNFMYVRVRNRGTDAAGNIKVAAYHCEPGTGLVWPDDWQPMTTAELSPPGTIAPGGDMVVGPFEWTPTEEGHECLLAIASADGDPGNDTTVTGSIPHSRFVPFDNNVGQRNVSPEPGGGGGAALAGAFQNRSFVFRNPFPWPIQAEVEVTLPEFLAKRGYELRIVSAGGARFTLGPRGSRKIAMTLKRGGDFRPTDVPADDRRIEVVSLADGGVVGGMTYLIDPDLDAPWTERPESGDDGRRGRCSDEARDLLTCLGLPGLRVKRAKIRRITVDIDLDDDC